MNQEDKRLHQFQISEIERFSREHEYWALSNVGRVRYRSQSPNFLRELYFVKLLEPSYDLKKWDRSKVIRIEIPEARLISYRLGQIFDAKGNTICVPNMGYKEIKALDIVLSNSRNKRSTGADDLNLFFEDTLYPSPGRKQKQSYYTHGYGNIQSFISTFLIAKVFYYRSSSNIHKIITNQFEAGLQKKIRSENENLIIYDSQKVTYEEACLFAELWSTDDQFSGYDKLLRTIRNFEKALFNDDKLGNENNRTADIAYELPYNFPLKVKVMGQYITTDRDKAKFMVYDFISEEPYNPDSKYSTVERILLQDDNDKTSTFSRNEKDSKGSIHISGNDRLKFNLPVDDNSSSNSSLEEREFLVDGGYQSRPKVTLQKIKRYDQENKYRSDRFIEKDITQNSINLEDRNSSSNSRLANIKGIDSSDNPLEESEPLLKQSLDYLSKEMRVTYQFVTINDSFHKYKSILNHRKTGKEIPIIIVRVMHNDKDYYIFDAGEGAYLGVAQNIGIPINNTNDRRLSIFLDVMLNRYHFRWSSIYYDGTVNAINEKKADKSIEIKTRFSFHILQPMEHLKSEKPEELIKNLAERIKRRIH